jgi:hypothetical protein
LVVDKLNVALVDFSRDEVAEFKRLLIKLNTRLTTTLDPKSSAEAKAPANAQSDANLKPAVGTRA